MYSNKILNFQESTILNACTKKVWKLIECSTYIIIHSHIYTHIYIHSHEYIYIWSWIYICIYIILIIHIHVCVCVCMCDGNFSTYFPRLTFPFLSHTPFPTRYTPAVKSWKITTDNFTLFRGCHLRARSDSKLCERILCFDPPQGKLAPFSSIHLQAVGIFPFVKWDPTSSSTSRARDDRF